MCALVGDWGGGGGRVVIFFQDTLSFTEGFFFSGSDGIRFKTGFIFRD